jgi:hypothetical protein
VHRTLTDNPREAEAAFETYRAMMQRSDE